jgi:hypothetical protein
MAKKFNKGEWSEFYAFIKILHDKKINILDCNLNDTNEFYKIKKIIRKEIPEATYILNNNEILKISNNKNHIILINTLKPYILKILSILKETKGSSFAIKDIENIFKILNSNSIKNGNNKFKSDINLILEDENLLNKNLGFNIKSYIGNPPTLLNSSRATNFKYEIINFTGDLNTVNDIKTKNKIRDRILYILKNSKSIKFDKIENNIFCNNLKLIDSLMPDIISEFLLNFYSGNGNKIYDIFNNKLNQNNKNYKYKFQAFLLGIALGFVPTKEWNGFDSSNGYIIVKNNGDIGCFSVLEKQTLAEYLFNNTRFDTPSTSRHDYGYAYKENNRYFIKLNIQIRF